MKLWKRLLITLVAMVLASFAVGFLWTALFGAALPSYLSGLIGGLSALATWEFLRAD